MRSLPILISVLLAAGACGEETAHGPADDYGGALADSQEQDEGAADGLPRPCGDDTCQADLCGYSCEPGVQCERACAAEDERPDEFIRFEIGGSESAVLDSRDVPYDPVFSLQNVLFYGCDLWDFSSGEKDGLELSYAEIIDGAFLAGDPSVKGFELEVYIDRFTGPGDYTAYGFASVSSERREAGDFYLEKEACSVSVDGDGRGGIEGSIDCPSVGHREDGRAISLRGEFACGQNAIHTIRVVRMPRDE